MTKNSDITYHPNASITPEQARDARARAWRFAFDRWEQKKAAGISGGEVNARKEVTDGSRNRTIP